MTTSRLRGVNVRHELKLWTDQFIAMQVGTKKADVRRCDDREFRRGDENLYRDYSQKSDSYTGRAMLARITHITRVAGTLDLFGVQNEGKTTDGISVPIAVLSIELLEIGTYEALTATTPLVPPPLPFVASPTPAELLRRVDLIREIGNCDDCTASAPCAVHLPLVRGRR
jgi:hypothetical protein